MKRLLSFIFICIEAIQLFGIEPVAPFAKGTGSFVYSDYPPFADRPLTVYYHIPATVDIKQCPAIFVFQGADRNYTYLLDAWKEEAEKQGFIVFVPQFELIDYPLCDYQEVGIMDKNHKIIRKKELTTPYLIDNIWQYICERLGNRQKGFRIYGHSAGGQFVQRFMLFHQSPYVEKAIIGSPGWYTMPDTTQYFSYGIKNINYIDRNILKRYIETPITLQLALGDTIRESYLRKTPEAELQGRNRLERGRTFYRFLQQMAEENGWDFQWTKVEEPELGHLSVEMGQRASRLLMNNNQVMPYQDIVNRLFTISDKYAGESRIDTLGKSPNGNYLIAFQLGNPDNKVKIWMQGALHGNEPAGSESLCRLVEWLTQTDEGSATLNNVSLFIVPVANPDGYCQNRRVSKSGLDLNRDQSKLADSLTWILKQAYTKFQPDVALDIHEYCPSKPEFAELCGMEASLVGDVLFLPSGHPNISPELSRLSNELFFPQAKIALLERGYSTGFYFTLKKTNGELVAYKDGKSPQSSATFQGLSGAVSLFIEIKGIGLSSKTFDRRADSGFIVAQNVVKTAAAHSDEIIKTVKSAEERNDTMTDSIYVKFHSSHTNATISFIGIGKETTIKRTIPVLDAMKPITDLARQRPQAYLLLDTCEQQIKRLQALGVVVEKLSKPQKYKVEQYCIDNFDEQSTLWEGIHPVAVDTHTTTKIRKFQAGTYYISMNQRQANLIATLLEPESACGFVNFRVIDVFQKKHLPIFRVTK